MGRVADATALAPRRSDDAIAVAMARSSNNGDGVVPPQPFNLDGHVIHRPGHMAVVRLILRLSSSRPRLLAAVPALLRLVVVPCLNAHKHHVRDPLYSFNSLLTL